MSWSGGEGSSGGERGVGLVAVLLLGLRVFHVVVGVCCDGDGPEDKCSEVKPHISPELETKHLRWRRHGKLQDLNGKLEGIFRWLMVRFGSARPESTNPHAECSLVAREGLRGWYLLGKYPRLA